MTTDTVAARFRQVLGQYPTGVVVVTATDADGQPLGMTVGTFSSVSLDPPLVAFMPQKNSGSWAAIRAAGSRFCINILSDTQEAVCRQVATRKTDKLAGIPWRPSAGGSPIIEASVAFVDCETVAVHDAGDHEIVIGLVTDLDVLGATNPLLFFRGGYGSFLPQSLAAGDADLVDQLRLVDLARPHMEELAADCDSEVTAISLVRDELVLTAAAGRAKTAQSPTRVGQRVPFMPPLGGVFAAWGDDRLRQHWLDRLGSDVPEHQVEIQRQAPDRILERGYSIAIGHTDGERLESLSTKVNSKDPEVSSDTLRDAIKRVTVGYNAGDLDESVSHELRSLSAPVFGPDGSVALTLTLWGPPGRISTAAIHQYAERLIDTAAAATLAVGGMLPSGRLQESAR
ncbi:flavin reductase [Salinibacterium sp. ZJ450]|uniref:flavin reductase n=1 Tax=Salinibacterium sp. ZJ450 TaxID=2708338 RepID=UPI00141E7EE4|nr:flavin reductase [Salinibacterium sp. ZJ450]